MTQREMRRADLRREQDQRAWSEPGVVYLSYDYSGTGPFVTDLISFGTVFVEPPFFTFGVELAPDEYLIEGDYPFVSCGVSAWETSDTDTFYYLGAYVWINVASSNVYNLRFRMAFEGMVFKNVEELRS